jgi:hypothetical protein
MYLLVFDHFSVKVLPVATISDSSGSTRASPNYFTPESSKVPVLSIKRENSDGMQKDTYKDLLSHIPKPPLYQATKTFLLPANEGTENSLSQANTKQTNGTFGEMATGKSRSNSIMNDADLLLVLNQAR